MKLQPQIFTSLRFPKLINISFSCLKKLQCTPNELPLPDPDLKIGQAELKSVAFQGGRLGNENMVIASRNHPH